MTRSATTQTAAPAAQTAAQTAGGPVLTRVRTRLRARLRGKLASMGRASTCICLALGTALSAALCTATQALAASSFGDMADNVKNELTRFGPLLQAAFALGGFFLVGLGLWQLWARSQQPGAPKGGAIIAIIIGCGLLGVATIAQMGAGTLGTGSPELSEIGL